MPALTLRPYQQDAIDAVFTARAQGIRLPLVVLPTGAGKTITTHHVASAKFRSPAHRSAVVVSSGWLCRFLRTTRHVVQQSSRWFPVSIR